MGGAGVIIVRQNDSKRESAYTIPDVKGRSVLFSMEDKELEN